MARPGSSERRYSLAALCSLVYAAFGVTWVSISDRLTAVLLPDPQQRASIQIYKSWLFVAASAALIYFLVRLAEHYRRAARTQAEVQADPPSAVARERLPVTGVPMVGQLVLLVMAVTLPLCGLLAWSIYRSAEDSVASSKRLVADLARITARDTAKLVVNAERVMRAVAQRGQVRALDPGHCDPALGDVPVLNTAFLNVATFDSQARLICSVLPLPPGSSLYFPNSPDREPVLREGRFTLSSPQVGTLSGRLAIIASLPIRDIHDEIIGAVSFSIDQASLRPVARPLLPQEGVIAIANSQGLMVHADRPDLIGGQATGTESIRLAIAQKSGEATARGFDGQLRNYYFAPIEGTDWVAVAGLPTSVIYGEARRSALRGGAFGLLIIFLAVLGGAWMSRRIADPILGIAEAASRVAEGNLNVRAPEGGSREAETVARQFNRMLDRLPLMEGELRESEHRYKSLFETSPECIFVHKEGRIVMINPAGARLYGAENPEHMVGMRVADLAHPDDRAAVEARIHKVTVQRRQLETRQLKNRRLDGTPIWIEVASLPFEYRGGPAVLTQLHDITASKQAEAQVRKLSRLYAALSRSNEAIVRETSRESLCQAVCRIIVEQGGFVTAGLRLLDAGGEAFVPVAAYGPVRNWVGERSIATAEAPSLMLRAIRERRTHVRHTIHDDPNGSLGQHDMEILGINSMAVLPLIVAGEGIGALSVFAAEEHYFDPELVALLEEMVLNLSFAFVKFDAEEARQESEQRYRALVDASPDAILLSIDGRFVLVNDAAVRLYRAAAPAELIGRMTQDFAHPEYRDEIQLAIIEMMARESATVHAEVRHVRLDGSVFDAEVVRSRLDYRGRPALQVIVRDISERKEAERRIARLTHLFAALSRTNEAIARATDSATLCETICKVAVEHGHFATAVITVLDIAREYAVPMAAYGRTAGLIGEDPVPLASSLHGGAGPLASALREGLVMVSNDVESDPRTEAARPDALRARVNSVAACPLTVDGQPWGAIIFYGDTPGFFDNEMIDLIKEMAQNLSFGLAKLQSDAAHRTSEVALRDSEVRYRHLFNVTPVCIYVRQDDKVAMINPAGVALFGAQSMDQLMGQPVADLVHPDYHPLMQQRFAQVIEEHASSGLAEFVNLRLDGTPIDTESVVTPLEFQGRPAVQVIVQDISARKASERALRRLNSELEERVRQRTGELQRVNQELSEFSYIVSHDLKAPLRGIASLVGWLEQDHGEQLGPEGRELLRLLSTRSRRMHRLIEDILHFSRLGRTRDSAREVDLDVLVHEVVDSLAVPSHIAVRVDPLPRVVGDETRLRQVFQNLISNAVKFMDKPEGRIEVGVQAPPGDAQGARCFFVADNGPGIEPRHHQRIFEIFQTLNPRDDPDSTGIGLTVVKKIIELLGGRIWVESESGKGSRFVFTLPRRQVVTNQLPAVGGDVHERPGNHTAG